VPREPWEWREEDLRALVDNGVPESLTLDYKQCGALAKRDQKKANDVSVDVSALANSQGGTVVYGIAEGPPHYPRELEAGFDLADNMGEWLEQVINSNIRPRSEGVRINEVRLSSGKAAFAVFVPQGRTAHQAADRRYYKRYNFQCLPMEDYEVRDVMRRGDAPDLRVELALETREVDLVYAEGHQYCGPIELKVLVRNVGERPAEYSVVVVYVPRDIEIEAPGL
jgi:hypothetical protein